MDRYLDTTIDSSLAYDVNILTPMTSMIWGHTCHGWSLYYSTMNQCVSKKSKVETHLEEKVFRTVFGCYTIGSVALRM